MIGEHYPAQRPLSAEPVSTFIGLTTLIASTGVSLAAAGAIGGFLITAAASFALSAAAAALQKGDQQSTLAGGHGVQGGQGALNAALRSPQVNPIPPQWLRLGNVTSSGVLAWRHSKPPFIWRMFLLAAHECGDLESMFLNGADVPLEDAGGGIMLPKAEPYYDGSTHYLEVAFRRGTADQAMCPIVARDFPDMPATFRQRGTATVTIKAHYGATDAIHETVYGSDNNFNPLFRLPGASYFDPRAPRASLSDPTTWVRGNSGSLNIMRALYHPWPNMRLLDPGRINWDKMVEAANIDDLWRGTRTGGLERNHTVDGIITSNADSLQTLREMLTAVDGLFISSKGRFHIVPGHRRKPIGTLTQDMLAGGFDIQSETADRDQINIVKTEIVAPDRDYKPVVGPVLKRVDLINKDGKPLETTLTLPFTEGTARGQRLGMRKLKRSRGDDGGTALRKSFSGLFNAVDCGHYQAGDVVRIYFRDIPHARMVIQIMNTERDETQNKVSISGASSFDSVFDFYAPEDEKEFKIDEDVLTAEAA